MAFNQNSGGMTAGEVFKKARSMFLPDVAEKLGFVFRKGQEKYYSNTCPSCGEGRTGGNGTSIFQDTNGVWRWNCFCCGKGGTSIDFVVHAKGMTDFDAAKYLVDERLAPVVTTKAISKAKESNQEEAKAMREVLALISKHGLQTEANVSGYLASRSIGEKTQKLAYERGQLRMLPSNPKEAAAWLSEMVGEARLRRAGLWREGAKWPAIAFRPLVSLLPGGTSAEFRIARDPASPEEPKGIRYGAMKWPWWWKGSNEAKKLSDIIVVEGVIDMWSLIEMGEDKNMHLMAIPGTGTWNATWMQQAAQINACDTGLVGVDHDEAGDVAATNMVTQITNMGIIAQRILPEAKDWNLDLRNGRKSIV